MKKIFLLVVCATLLVSCDESGRSSKVQTELDSLQSVIDKKDLELNDLMGTFNEIQQGFNLINEAEGRINLMSANTEENGVADNIRENMKYIQDKLIENRAKIEELQKKLKSSNIAAGKFKESVENLTNQLKEKAVEIEKLRLQLAEKDVVIASLNDSLFALSEEHKLIIEKNAKTEEIARVQDQMLNTAWYVFGTSRELKEHRILVKGDVLQTNDFNKDYFTKIDIRKTTVIPLSSKSAKILTTHPKGSYELMEDSKGEYTLRILDAGKFWSVSKYLVIRVK